MKHTIHGTDGKPKVSLHFHPDGSGMKVQKHDSGFHVAMEEGSPEEEAQETPEEEKGEQDSGSESPMHSKGKKMGFKGARGINGLKGLFE